MNTCNGRTFEKRQNMVICRTIAGVLFLIYTLMYTACGRGSDVDQNTDPETKTPLDS